MVSTCSAHRRAGQPDRRRCGRARLQAAQRQRAVSADENTLEIRPMHHRLDDRVRAHVFICMLAHYVQLELASGSLRCCSATTRHSLPPTRSPPRNDHPRPQPRPQRPHQHGQQAHTLPDLLDDLGTLCRNTLRIGHSEPPSSVSPPRPSFKPPPSSCSAPSSNRRQNQPAQRRRIARRSTRFSAARPKTSV